MNFAWIWASSPTVVGTADSMECLVLRAAGRESGFGNNRASDIYHKTKKCFSANEIRTEKLERTRRFVMIHQSECHWRLDMTVWLCLPPGRGCYPVSKSNEIPITNLIRRKTSTHCGVKAARQRQCDVSCVSLRLGAVGEGGGTTASSELRTRIRRLNGSTS